MTEPVDPSQSPWAPQSPYQAPQPPYQAPQPPYQAPQPPYQAPQPPYETPGQLGYTPQQYPAYPGPGYVDPGYQAQPGYPPYGQYVPPPEQPQRRRSKILVIALVVIVLAAAGGITAVLIGNSDSSSPSASKGPLRLPATLGSFQQLPGGTADAFRSRVRDSYGTGGIIGNFFSTATIGTYGPDVTSDPKLVLIAADSSKFPSLDASSLGGSSGPLGAQTFPGGTHGGTIECTDLSFGTAKEVVCFWSDPQTVGYLFAVNTTLDQSDIAGYVGTARDSLDH